MISTFLIPPAHHTETRSCAVPTRKRSWIWLELSFFFLIRTEALYNRRACAKANQQVQKDLQKLSHCLYILLLLSCWKLHISFKDISMQSCCKCLLHTGPTKKQFCKTLTISRLIVWNFLQSLLRWGIFFDIHWNYITAPLLVFWGSLAWNYRHLADWCWLGQLRQNQRS